MIIKTVKIKSLKLDEGNVREHDDGNIEAIKNSIRSFGQQKPVVALKDGTVIAGNGTLIAMRKLGHKDIVVAETELEGNEATAYAIADNRVAELANWDTDALASALDQLSGNLPKMAGYNSSDIEAISPDLSILDDFDTLTAMDMEDDVRKSIHISIPKEHSEQANKKATQLRADNYYLGGALIAKLEELYGA